MKPLSLLSLTAAVTLCAGAATAQSQYTFDVDSSTSNFNFSGNSSEGRIAGRPPRFDMDGTAEALLTRTAGALSTGEINGGALNTVPARIKAEVPNVFSWLPPLATIYIDDAVYTPSSASFSIDGSGNFATDIVMTPIAGTVTVIPLIGGTEVTNLADYGPSDPTPVAGTFFDQGATVDLNLPVDVDFLDDDGMGGFVELNIDGTLVATAPVPQDMMLSTPGAVVAGATADFNVTAATPSTPTFLAYGLSLGSTPVGPLGVTLGLANAQQLGGTVVSDGSGNADWTEGIPAAASGLTAYLQACQSGNISNVLTVAIQ